jgi:hypothetical protein
MSDEAIRASLPAALREELRDEQLVWSGRPRQGLTVSRRQARAIPLTMSVLVVSVMGQCAFWCAWGHSSARGSVVLEVIWASVVVWGLYLAVGRFLHAAYMRGQTWYALTSTHLVTATVGRHGLESDWVDLVDDVSAIEMTAEPDGYGDVRFDAVGTLPRFEWLPFGLRPALEDIPDVHGVVRTINELRRMSRAHYSEKRGAGETALRAAATPYRDGVDLREGATCVREQLEPGEHLMWWAQPVQGFKLRPRDIYVIPHRIAALAVAIMFEVLAVTQWSHLPAIMMAIAGLPFLAFMWESTVGGRVRDVAERARTWYAITSERAIIIKQLGQIRQVEWIDLQPDACTLNVTERRGGVGRIQFELARPPLPRVPVDCPFHSFDMIRDVQAVARHARAVQGSLPGTQRTLLPSGADAG